MTSHLDPPLADVRALVQRALAEDLTPLGDLTASLLDPDLWADGEFVAREAGVVAGRLCVVETFDAVDERLTVDWELPDGSTVQSGQRIATVRGPLATMLTAERTALNLLSHLSGVATQVRTFVDRAGREGADLGHPQDHAGPAQRSRRPRCGPVAASTTGATSATGS